MGHLFLDIQYAVNVVCIPSCPLVWQDGRRHYPAWSSACPWFHHLATPWRTPFPLLPAAASSLLYPDTGLQRRWQPPPRAAGKAGRCRRKKSDTREIVAALSLTGARSKKNVVFRLLMEAEGYWIAYGGISYHSYYFVVSAKARHITWNLSLYLILRLFPIGCTAFMYFLNYT